MLVALMLLFSANSVLAADDTLDIEKAAIQAIKNSLAVQSLNRQVTLAQKAKSNVDAAVGQARGTLPFANYVGLNPYQLVEQIVLGPLEAENALTLITNAQAATVNAVRLGAYKAYIGLVKVNSALNIQKSLVDNLAADYKIAQQKQALGLITPDELRLTAIAYLKAEYAYDSLQKNFNSTLLAVNSLMGKDLSQTYSIFQDYNITPSPQIKPLTEYVDAALANRAEILNAQNTLAVKKKEYEYGVAEIPTDFEFYKQKQQFAIDSAQNGLDLAKINVELDITNRYQSLEQAMKNLEAMKALDEQAEINYQAAQTQYDNSLITLSQLDAAKIARAQADMNYKNAQLDAWLEQTTMDMACRIGVQPPSNLQSSLGNGQPSSRNNPDPATKGRHRDN